MNVNPFGIDTAETIRFVHVPHDGQPVVYRAPRAIWAVAAATVLGEEKYQEANAISLPKMGIALLNDNDETPNSTMDELIHGWFDSRAAGQTGNWLIFTIDSDEEVVDPGDDLLSQFPVGEAVDLDVKVEVDVKVSVPGHDKAAEDKSWADFLRDALSVEDEA